MGTLKRNHLVWACAELYLWWFALLWSTLSCRSGGVKMTSALNQSLLPCTKPHRAEQKQTQSSPCTWLKEACGCKEAKCQRSSVQVDRLSVQEPLNFQALILLFLLPLCLTSLPWPHAPGYGSIQPPRPLSEFWCKMMSFFSLYLWSNNLYTKSFLFFQSCLLLTMPNHPQKLISGQWDTVAEV